MVRCVLLESKFADGPLQMTELDFTTLAIVGRDGPLSAYDVRKVFAASVTPMWSSSPGAVYPSIRRLEQAGLTAASSAQGSRSRKALSITPAGRITLDRWLTRIPPEIAAPTPDPIRTRMYFLKLLDPPKRRMLVAEAIRATQEAVTTVERRLGERSADQPGEVRQLAAQGVLYELRARLEWLAWLSERLDTL